VSRGLDMYAVKPARQDAVEDLLKRRTRAQAKIAALNAKADNPSPSKSTADRSPKAPTPEGVPQLERLICARCQSSFARPRTRGRKPQLCPSCRTGAAQ
jgi:DNA polymerase-3 subunit epsilon